MPTIRLGDYADLVVCRQVDFGLYLDGGRAGEILLPQRYVPQGLAIGDTIHVFIYLDQEERLVATTETPLAVVGDFAYLRVSWVNEYGAFLHWGLMKDLFCPFREQKRKMLVGESYIVHIHVDEESYRIVASAKVERYLTKDVSALHVGQAVDLLVWQKTELGMKVIINNAFAGLIYDNTIFTPIHTGDHLRGFITRVRDDGKVDVAPQQSGKKLTHSFAETLHDYLVSHDGRCTLTDASLPEDIYRTFGVSKKVFKKAVGELYKRHVITINSNDITLTNK